MNIESSNINIKQTKVIAIMNDWNKGVVDLY